MPMIHWVVTDVDGELVGQYACLRSSSSIRNYNNYSPPAGYIKSLLSYEEYEKICFSFNKERKIYEQGIDPIEARAIELSEERKAINEVKAKPNKYRERINTDGNMVKEYYDKDGNLEIAEVVDKNGNPILP